MSNTTFVDGTTVIFSSWLNDINNLSYNVLGNGTLVPTTVAALLTNLGVLSSAQTAATYLTQANAASTYLTQSNAAATYLTQANASTTYAALAGATFTGTVVILTPAFGDSSTKAASTAFVQQNRTLNGRNAQGAAYLVATSDLQKLIDATTGTWALTMNPTTLGANFSFSVRNSGSGVITLTPTTGTIDGLATAILNPNESCLVFCDGTNFETVGRGVNNTAWSANLSPGSRALNTVYTNSGKTRHVEGYCSNGGAGVIEGQVNGIAMTRFTAASGAPEMPFWLEVPAGATYQVNNSGAVTIVQWHERDV